MKIIKISKDKYAQVDDCDFDYLNQYRWHLYKKKSSKISYAYRGVSLKNGKRSTTSMHRDILMLNNPSVMVDHIDGDGLNNIKNNLRIATHSQNAANRPSIGKSNYRGVSIIKTKYKEYWYAKCSKGEILKTKICKSEIEAAKAYNDFAMEIHSGFARLNIIQNA